MIYGNTEGVKKTDLLRLEELLEYAIPQDLVLDEYVVDLLVSITEKINREIIIVIDSRNMIVTVGIGDHKTAPFPDIEKFAKKRGLNGLNTFHTHPNGYPNLSTADMSSLMKLRFNIIGAIGQSSVGKAIFNVGLLHVEEQELMTKEYGTMSLQGLNSFEFHEYNQLVDKFLREQVSEETTEEERAVLVGVNLGIKGNILEIEDSMNELKELTLTAEGSVVAQLIQNKEKVDNTFYIGKGKLEELRLIIQNTRANIVICNDELSSIQLKVMETYLGVKVIDRTQLILDIFAKHARTSDGKLQVELAQLKYRLPRLLGMGQVLSRTGGGIGTRGPGETKLETDRRTIYKEIHILESRIHAMKSVRSQQKSKRLKNQVPIISLVGYTNAGKSTLFNVLTSSSVLSENKLFATLDSTTRKMKDTDKEMLLQDTVGFIDKLPHDLVKAFESTLEGVVDSDLLLHVIDASNENFLKQIQLVDQVLTSLHANNKKIIYVFNKIDSKCSDFEDKASTIRETKINISAKYETGIMELQELIQKEVYGNLSTGIIQVPYDDIGYLSTLHNLGVVDEEEYQDDGIQVKVHYTKEMEHLLKKYL